MEKASKKSTGAAKTKPASAARLQPVQKKERPSKPLRAASGTSTRKVSKYEQSGAPWWKQHLPE